MAAPLAQHGFDDFLYRNTGTYGSPTWNVITDVRDVDLNLDKDKGDAASRASKWKKKTQGMLDATLEFDMLDNPTTDDYDVLQNAYASRTTVLDIAVADQAIATSGTHYFRADLFVSKFSIKQPLNDAATVSVGMDLAYTVNEPIFVTV